MAGDRTHSQTVLVVGGGIAGITTAVEVAEDGYGVVLIEKGPALGGRVAHHWVVADRLQQIFDFRRDVLRTRFGQGAEEVSLGSGEVTAR